jgi:NitT/TauT family transport system ATP-binding protein
MTPVCLETAEDNAATQPKANETLVISDVGLTYTTKSGVIEALQGVSLSVGDGEFISIVGPSGCGKSSLLKLVLGLERATIGDISIAGTRISGPTKSVGCVFQSPVLLPWRTIRDNVLLPVDIMKLDRVKTTQRANNLLKMAGLGGFEELYPFELSGGMQQKVAIVRALVHNPRLLMMDEPFAALDAMTREQMSLELQRLWIENKKTIVFITHSIPEAAFLSDRVVVMSSRPGRIVAVFNNTYPRPRSFSDLSSPELARLMASIRESLNQASVL